MPHAPPCRQWNRQQAAEESDEKRAKQTEEVDDTIDLLRIRFEEWTDDAEHDGFCDLTDGVSLLRTSWRSGRNPRLFRARDHLVVLREASSP